MSGKVGQLYIEILGDASKFEAALSGITSDVKKIETDMSGSFDDVGDAWARSMEPAIGAFDEIGDAAEQSATKASAAIGNIEEGWDKADRGTKKFAGGLRDVAQTITNVVIGLQTVPGLMNETTAAYAGMAVIGINIAAGAAQAVNGITDLREGYLALVQSVKAFELASKLAFLTTPWGLALIAITAVVAALVVYEMKTHAISNSLKPIIADFDALNKSAEQLAHNQNIELKIKLSKDSNYEGIFGGLMKGWDQYVSKINENIDGTAAAAEKAAETIVMSFEDVEKVISDLSNEFAGLKGDLDALTGAQTNSATASDNVAQATKKQSDAQDTYDKLIKTTSSTVKDYFNRYQQQTQGSAGQIQMLSDVTKTLGKDGAAAFNALIDAHKDLATASGDATTAINHAKEAANELTIATGKVNSEGGLQGIQTQMDVLAAKIANADEQVRILHGDLEGLGDINVSPNINVNTGTGKAGTTGAAGTSTNPNRVVYGDTGQGVSPSGAPWITLVENTNQPVYDWYANGTPVNPLIDKNSSSYDAKVVGFKDGVPIYAGSDPDSQFGRGSDTAGQAGAAPATGGVGYSAPASNLPANWLTADLPISEYKDGLDAVWDDTTHTWGIIDTTVKKSNEVVVASHVETAKTTQKTVETGNAGILNSHAGMAVASIATVQGMGSNISNSFNEVASSVAASLASLKSAATSCAGGLCGSTAVPLTSALSEVATPSAAGGYSGASPSRFTPVVNAPVTIQSAVFQKDVDVSRFLTLANANRKTAMTQAGLS